MSDMDRWARIGLELFVGIGAVYGGIGLLWNNRIGMPDDWLTPTPFNSWVVPALLLLLVVAVPMGVAAWLEAGESPWAELVTTAAAAAVIVWIVAQLLIIRQFHILQPAMLAAGVAILFLNRRLPQ